MDYELELNKYIEICRNKRIYGLEDPLINDFYLYVSELSISEYKELQKKNKYISDTVLYVFSLFASKKLLKIIVYFSIPLDKFMYNNLDGLCPLFCAFENNIAAFNALIRLGADINTQIFGGYSLLHIACKKLDSYKVDLLCKMGININLRDSFGKTVIEDCLFDKKKNNLLDVILKYNQRAELFNKCRNNILDKYLSDDPDVDILRVFLSRKYYPSFDGSYIFNLIENDRIDVFECMFLNRFRFDENVVMRRFFSICSLQMLKLFNFYHCFMYVINEKSTYPYLFDIFFNHKIYDMLEFDRMRLIKKDNWELPVYVLKRHYYEKMIIITAKEKNRHIKDDGVIIFLQYILYKGINITKIDPISGNSVVHIIAKNFRSYDIFEFLRQAKINFRAKNRNGESVLSIIESRPDEEYEYPRMKEDMLIFFTLCF